MTHDQFKSSYICAHCSATTVLKGHFKNVPLLLFNSTNAFRDDPTVCQPYMYIGKSLFGLMLLPTWQNSFFASLLHPTWVYECSHTAIFILKQTVVMWLMDWIKYYRMACSDKTYSFNSKYICSQITRRCLGHSEQPLLWCTLVYTPWTLVSVFRHPHKWSLNVH